MSVFVFVFVSDSDDHRCSELLCRTNTLVDETLFKEFEQQQQPCCVQEQSVMFGLKHVIKHLSLSL